jgi:hypothetical protein
VNRPLRGRLDVQALAPVVVPHEGVVGGHHQVERHLEPPRRAQVEQREAQAIALLAVEHQVEPLDALLGAEPLAAEELRGDGLRSGSPARGSPSGSGQSLHERPQPRLVRRGIHLRIERLGHPEPFGREVHVLVAQGPHVPRLEPAAPDLGALAHLHLHPPALALEHPEHAPSADRRHHRLALLHRRVRRDHHDGLRLFPGRVGRGGLRGDAGRDGQRHHADYAPGENRTTKAHGSPPERWDGRCRTATGGSCTSIILLRTGEFNRRLRA